MPAADRRRTGAAAARQRHRRPRRLVGPRRADVESAQKMLLDPQEPPFDAILLDLWLPGEEAWR
jgi:hypothetical protein